jgi:hypothetical protein
MTAILLHSVKQPCRVGKGAHSRAVPTRRRMPRSRPVTRGHGARSRCAISSSRQAPLPTLRHQLSTRPHYSLLLFAIRFLHSPPPRGGRSADGARMHARHPSRHAMTGMQTPLSIDTGRHDRLAFIAHPGRARPAIDFRTSGKPEMREASCVPSDGTLAFRRSTWDFWPGPVLAVVRQSLQDHAPTSFDAWVIVTRRSRSREPPRRGR